MQIQPDPKNADAGIVEMQVFEDLTGALIGDEVVFTGKPLSVLLGPGLLTSVWDGLQNPLYKLSEEDPYLKPGMKAPALDETALWVFTPSVKVGDTVSGGDAIGAVPEGKLNHKILVPFDFVITSYSIHYTKLYDFPILHYCQFLSEIHVLIATTALSRYKWKELFIA